MERTGVVGGSDQDSKGPKDTGGHFYLATLIGTHSHGSFPCALSLHLRGQWHSKWRQIRPNQSPSFAQLELHLPVALPSNLRIPFILSPVDITCAWPTPTLTPSLGLFQDKTLSVSLVLPVYSSQEVLSLTWSLSFYLQPVRRLKGKPENAFDGKAADLLAMRTSSVFGAPDVIRPTVNKVASFQLPPARVIPRQSPSTLTPPPLWGSTALRGPVLTFATQSKAVESSGATSAPGNLRTCCSTSARFPLLPQVLTTPGFPTRGPLQSTMFPTSPTTKEPRGDI